ncbi:MAG: tape measure protein [Muribaculaceae bacterium]|nr:tape measure protein [Muribaculaceae bacterium]
MADDRLVFPIGFDLDAAVKKAASDWDGKYADQLQKAIQKRALEVKLKLSTKNFDSLEDVKKRLAELKLEPITPETKTAIKELAAELRTLAKALEQVQKYSAGRGAASPDAVRAARINEINQRNADKTAIALENQRAAAARAAAAEERLAIARDKSAQAAARTAKGVKDLTNAYKEQSSYLNRLLQRMVTYWSVQQVRQFLISVREVTAQFELQRVSLGAIIQDQARANALFSEIKGFALKSPISILDLTKYTKQVAAYRIETDKLFDTTKRIMDVSVGLGVDAGRLVLAYGQVKAASYLRAAEIRQFTEAGIPMLELLAEKFTKLNGEMVTTEQVMDMVSKRGVEFGMVEEIFNDMTSAGGMFYNMQEKQGNTLFGLWAKLGDAASVMYDEIGNTDKVNSAMKGTIEMLTDLMRNWREVGRTMAVAGGIFGANFIVGKVKGWQGNINTAKIAANEKYIAASNAYRSAIQAEQAARMSATAEEYKAIAAKTASAEATYTAARAEYLAARNTTLWGKAIDKLKSFVVGNWITLLIAGVAALAMSFYNAYEKANKLKNALNEIEDESNLEQLKSVRNFETLAKTAVDAADGSKKQKDALDELNRTYKDIIPQERLTIENLRAMDGAYDSLTQSIRTYIAEQMKQKKISTIIEQTGKTIIDEQRDINNFLSKQGYSDAQIGRFWIEYEHLARTTNKSVKEMFTESWKAIGGTDEQIKELYTMYRRFGGDMIKYDARLQDITAAYREQERQIARVEAQYDSNYMALGRYGQGYEELVNKIKENPITVDGKIVDENSNSYLYGQQKRNLEVLETIVPTLKTIMSDAKVAWQDGWATLVDTIDTANPQIISTIDFDAINKYLSSNIKSLTDEQRRAVYKLQEIYSGLTISDRTVLTFRSKLTQLSIAAGVEMGSMTKYFMNAGDKIEDYAKRIKEAIDDLDNQIKEMNTTNQMIAEGGHGPLKGFSEEEIKKIEMQVAVLRELFPFLQGFTKSSGRTPADPRLQTLQEIANKMAEVNKEYDELLKKEGQTKALTDTQKLFASSFKQMQETAKKYKFKLPTFEVPQTIEDVQKWYKAIADEIKRLGLKNADKVLIELGFKSDKVAIDKQQKDIEKKLKDLADRISRTKTAKEFYEKILSQTGDVELAAQVTLSLYGDTGEGLFDATVQQIQEIFKSNTPNVTIDLSSAIDTKNQRINYGALAKLYEQYQNVISEANRSTAEKIISEGQKAAAANISTWEKELAKAKDFEQQRTDIINREAQRRAAIIASYEYTPEEKEQKVKESERLQKQELAKVDVEEFKASDDYIKVFQDLDNVATSSLDRIEAELKRLIEANKDLDATNLKTYVDALEKIREAKEQRAPLKAVTSGVKDYIAAIKERKAAENELKTAQADYDAQLPQVEAEIDSAQKEKDTADTDVVEAHTQLLLIQQQMAELRAQEIVDEQALAALQAQEVNAQNVLVNAQLRQNTAAANLTKAEDKRTGLTKKLQAAQKKVTSAQDKQKKAVKSVAAGLNQANQNVGAMSDALSSVKDLLGDAAANGTVLGGAIEGGIQALETFQKLMAVLIALQTVYNIVTESNPWIAIAAAVLAVAGILTGAIKASKIAAANKEIEKQQAIIDRLEYAYSRLEKTMDKVFGRDYINTYKQQMANLQAQAAAYQKQAAAERSKGKDADDEKIKQYQESYRDTMDQIADMQGQIAEQMTGTDVASAARDFASAWLEAYASFGSTADAIKEKFNDMIKNMLVESIMARTVQQALEPMFEKMDEMYASGASMTQVLTYAFTESADLADTINRGLTVAAQQAEAAGVDIRNLFSTSDGLTGISRDIATASEESINGLAAGINTQNFYISHVPAIAADVAAIRAALTASAPDYSVEVNTGIVDLVSLQTQSLTQLQSIDRHAAEILTECRASAATCQEIAANLARVIKPRDVTPSHVLHVRM